MERSTCLALLHKLHKCQRRFIERVIPASYGQVVVLWVLRSSKSHVAQLKDLFSSSAPQTTDHSTIHPIGGAPRTQTRVPGIELVAVHKSLWKSQVFMLSVFIFHRRSRGPALGMCGFALYALATGRDCGRVRSVVSVESYTSHISTIISSHFYESSSLSHSVRLSLEALLRRMRYHSKL